MTGRDESEGAGADPWRLLETWDVTPELAMGLDEALLDGPSPPTLRFYTWLPGALSLGYFQRIDDVSAALRAPVVVRRLTGGGAIHHARELTFSLSAPLTHPLYRGPVANSYTRVHAVVIAALRSLAVPGALAGLAAGRLRSDTSSTGMCFHASTALDIVWDGRKGVGSAQRRRAGRVLHHGSIKLGTTELEGDIATTAGAGRNETPRELAGVLRAAFEARVARLEPAEPTPEELVRAAELGARYVEPAWVRRR